MGRTNRRRQNRTTAARNRTEGSASTETASRPLPGLSRRPKPRWRQTFDAWGGLPVFLVIGGVIVLVAFLAIRSWPTAPSTGALMGEEVPMASTAHVAGPEGLDIPAGQPPAGGPHYAMPLRAGIYGAPVDDGNVIHSLEHGMLWISYRPDLISDDDLAILTSVARANSRDVILSPRPGNTNVADIVSWGRRMALEAPIDESLVRQFINTNRDRAPEPGVR